MLGWVAATGKFGIEAGVLFMLQFFWQFPHFWAIGWFLHEDYQKAGFNMLPTGKRDKGTALQTIIYTVWTVLISIVPVFGFTGRLQLSVIAMILTLGVGFWFLYYGFKLFKNQTDKAARQLMLSSVVYITVIQIIYVLDKFIRLWI
jgi:protoheme IX farnesyltransferase